MKQVLVVIFGGALVGCWSESGLPTRKRTEDAAAQKPMSFAGGLDKLRSGDRVAGLKGFLVYSDSKIYTRTIVDPALIKNHEMSFYGPDYWRKDLAIRFASGLGSNSDLSSRVNLNSVSLPRGENGSNNGKNIRITLFFGLNKLDEPYAIKVTIRQGNLFWEKNIERDRTRNWAPLGASVNTMGPNHGKLGNIITYDISDISQIVTNLFCLAERCQ